MSTRLSIADVDFFYISYDEPQKEEFWAKLVEQVPWAQRVDGIKGFDAAHKRCAELSGTDRFVTVDGDNTVYPEFIDLSFEIPDDKYDCVFSWAGRNIINGLCYGNGGLKLWTRDFVLNMRSHESASSEAERVDFCWDKKYVQVDGIFSDTHPNGSPFQAFRAGFREGVKMTLDAGCKINDPAQLKQNMHPKNLARLLTWANIGSDVQHGDWAIYGARLGIYMTNIEAQFDISKISDYDWFKTYFSEQILSKFDGFKSDSKCRSTGASWNSSMLRHEIESLAVPIKKALGIPVTETLLTADQSQFFKLVNAAKQRRSTSKFVLKTEIEADNEQ